MGLLPGADAAYTFTASGLSSFDPTSYVLLEDKVVGGNWHNFRHNNAYSFNQTTGEDPNRFVLHFTPAASITSTGSSCAGDGQISVTQPGIANWSYAITDNQGNMKGSGVLNQNSPINQGNLAAGNYTLTLQDNQGYTVVKSVTVGGVSTVDAAFTMSSGSAQVYQNINFHCTTPNAVDYEWEFSDGTIITGVANPDYAFLEPGTYTVTLTVTNQDGCQSTITQVINVTESTTGIADLTKAELQVYSFRNNVIVDFSKMKDVDATIQVYNMLGQELSNEPFTTSSIYRKNITNVEAAYVIVKINNNGTIYTKKVFIVNK